MNLESEASLANFCNFFPFFAWIIRICFFSAKIQFFFLENLPLLKIEYLEKTEVNSKYFTTLNFNAQKSWKHQ